MTTRKLSSEKLLDKQLFRNMTRRRLPHVLVAFLANFFSISVPFMLWMGDLQSRLERGTYTYERFVEKTVDNVEATMIFNLVILFILGIYFGIITMGYMMRRRSAHFYHALPQKRETLYTTSIASALFCALLGGLATLVIAVIQLASFSMLAPEVLATFGILLAQNCLYFLISYAITVFAGSFSGGGLVQALMTLVIFFYPVATYAGVVLTRSLYSNYFWESYYYSEEIMQWLSPVFYAGFNYLSEPRVLPILLALVAIVVLLLGGMAIYGKRAIENAEKPIMFAKLGTVIKFMLMFTVTVYAGLFFNAIGSTLFHTLFGYTCGAWLSFMLLNTILHKSPKAMFKGMKGIAVFAAAFTLFLAVCAFDVCRLDTYVPDENNLSRAEIRISNAEIDDEKFTDPEMLSALSTLLQNQLENNKKGVTPPLGDSKTRFTVMTVMYTKLGIPFARRYTVSKYTEGAEAFLRLYADDARMHEKYLKVADTVDRLIAEGYTARVQITGTSQSWNEDLAEFWTIYKQEYGTANYDRLSRPVVAIAEMREFTNKANGDVYYSLYEFIDDLEYGWTEFPIYADMTGVIEYLQMQDAKLHVTYTNEYGAEQEAVCAAAYLYDTRTLAKSSGVFGTYASLSQYPMIELDTETGVALGDMLSTYRYHTVSRVFFAIDTSCVLQLVYGEPDNSKIRKIYYEDEYGIKTTVAAENAYYNEYTYVFPKGMVPENVKAMLGE